MSQPPRYGPAGWEHWPDFPVHSMQLARTLGMAQQGAATLSECMLAASRIVPDDPVSWHREWATLARASRTRADAAERVGALATARANLLRAASYWRASEQFLPPPDGVRHDSFQRGIECSRDWLRLSSPPGEALAITAADGSVVDAYWLRPAACSERAPAVICFGGLDAHKDEMLPRVWPQASERGIAVLLVDLPGQGETLRLRGSPSRADIEVPVAACVDALLRRPEVDANRIGLYGASLGGVYAARAAAREPRLRAVVSDSCIFDLQDHLRQRLAVDGGSGWDYLLWVFACATPQQAIDKAGNLRMAGFAGEIACPWFIVQGEHDFLGVQTARDAFDFARAAGVAVEFKVIRGEETGAAHCQADNPTPGQEMIWDWFKHTL
ncbi:alpha/beta hydrolase family protein [Variovorax sp. PBL-E5]|uniref:alpha/beta hydrolase family protein n=1 Tax=Variovorax sp. PBL-E5 TaxID=434014 RepID=UPI0013194684|nr:alpha/beta fold hydrolase [Variovorax sp. PBL-E5]VTU22254.1 2,6-dihydropseudooxynicotine hydrolase [Variovorax sp. PBL-E5]